MSIFMGTSAEERKKRFLGLRSMLLNTESDVIEVFGKKMDINLFRETLAALEKTVINKASLIQTNPEPKPLMQVNVDTADVECDVANDTGGTNGNQPTPSPETKSDKQSEPDDNIDDPDEQDVSNNDNGDKNGGEDKDKDKKEEKNDQEDEEMEEDEKEKEEDEKNAEKAEAVNGDGSPKPGPSQPAQQAITPAVPMYMDPYEEDPYDEREDIIYNDNDYSDDYQVDMYLEDLAMKNCPHTMNGNQAPTNEEGNYDYNNASQYQEPHDEILETANDQDCEGEASVPNIPARIVEQGLQAPLELEAQVNDQLTEQAVPAPQPEARPEEPASQMIPEVYPRVIVISEPQAGDYPDPTPLWNVD